MVDASEKKRRPCMVPVCYGERFDLVHKFPMESERTVQWLEALNIPELYKVPVEKLRTSYFICSRHFRNQDYKNAISRHLNKTAIPCLNLHNLDQLELVKDRCASLKPVAGASNVDNVGRPREVCKRKLSSTDEFNSEDTLLAKVASLEDNAITLMVKDTGNGEDDGGCVNINVETSVEPIICEKSPQDGLHGVDEKFIFMHTDSNCGQLDNGGMATNFIEVNHPDFSDILTLDNFWLRDHCRCKACFNHVTNQRRYSLLDIPMEVKPLETGVREGKLYVRWDDGHESSYNFDFLYFSQLISVKSRAPTRYLWNKQLALRMDYARVNIADLVTTEDAVMEVIQSLINFGCAFIENVPPNQDMTEMTVRRLFPMQKTLFGEMWTFSDKPDHSDTAYTKEYLGPHTDNTYFSDAAGLQVFHCITHKGTGGETILMDGFKIIDDLKAKNQSSYENLCKVHVPAEFIEKGQHHTYSAPVIKLDELRNSPEQIRFNLYDRAVFDTLPQTEMFQFYKDFRELAKLVQSEENMWRFKLKPGTVLIFDNWRILHGREAYTGYRELSGCYVSRTDFMSKAKSLGLLS